MSSQLDRIKRADDLLSTVYEEMLNGDIEDDCLQAAVFTQVTVNRIVFKLNDWRQEDE